MCFRLEFSPELSKLERAKWHSMAHRKGLRTESQVRGAACCPHVAGLP